MSVIVDRPVPLSAITPVPARPHPVPAAPAPTVRPLNASARARGFALYVGLDEEKARAAGIDLPRLVEALKNLAAELVPDVETHASVALAPADAGGRDLDIVRLALQDPAALARRNRRDPAAEAPDRTGVVVDISRRRVTLDGDQIGLTYKEFALLQYLVLREGQTIHRTELIASLWDADEEDTPNERTIDVHVRRLRAKLGEYEDIVRTVRGIGYRFDRHADVSIRHGATRSPDLF